jgi:HEPN domain-containing protein
MKPITREWISKAEGDWNCAGILFRNRKHPNYDGACFHTQQCAEKYLNARLEEAGVSFGKTHDLEKLLSQVLSLEPTWSILRQDMTFLTDFSVEYRYPGSSANRADAKEAIKRCGIARSTMRKAFGLRP